MAHGSVPAVPSLPGFCTVLVAGETRRYHLLDAGQRGVATGCDRKTIPAMSDSNHARFVLGSRSPLRE